MLIPRLTRGTMARTGDPYMHTDSIRWECLVARWAPAPQWHRTFGKVPTLPTKEPMDSILLPYSMWCCWAQSGKDVKNNPPMPWHFLQKKQMLCCSWATFLKNMVLSYIHTHTHTYTVFVYMFIYSHNKSTSLFVSCIIYSIVHTNKEAFHVQLADFSRQPPTYTQYSNTTI